jgi:hypothetical protein
MDLMAGVGSAAGSAAVAAAGAVVAAGAAGALLADGAAGGAQAASNALALVAPAMPKNLLRFIERLSVFMVFGLSFLKKLSS